MSGEPITIYLVRHGEMELDRSGPWSVDRMNQYAMGRMQAGLSALGRRQAERVGDYLQPRGITRIYTSTFLRARETAAPLAEHLDLKPSTLAEVGELNPGAIPDEGLPRLLFTLMAPEGEGANEDDAPQALRDWLPPSLERQMRSGVGLYLTMNHLAEWLRGRTTDGEGVREGFDRVAGALRKIARANPGGRVAVFTHGYFILLSILHSIAAWPPGASATLGKILTVPNGSVTKLERNRFGRLALGRAAESRHLDGVRG